jgi:hypothetical protein
MSNYVILDIRVALLTDTTDITQWQYFMCPQHTLRPVTSNFPLTLSVCPVMLELTQDWLVTTLRMLLYVWTVVRVLYSTVLSTVLYSLEYCTVKSWVLYSTVWVLYSTVWVLYSTVWVQYSTVRVLYSTVWVQYSVVQWNLITPRL